MTHPLIEKTLYKFSFLFQAQSSFANQHQLQTQPNLSADVWIHCWNLSVHFSNRAKLCIINVAISQGDIKRVGMSSRRISGRWRPSAAPFKISRSEPKQTKVHTAKGNGVCNVCGRESRWCGDNSVTSRNPPSENLRWGPTLNNDTLHIVPVRTSVIQSEVYCWGIWDPVPVDTTRAMQLTTDDFTSLSPSSLVSSLRIRKVSAA